jgi:hypothetical protein
MSKEETTPGGLLSKVAKVCAQPHGQLDGARFKPGRRSRRASYSKQMLKEMIERKRQQRLRAPA